MRLWQPNRVLCMPAGLGSHGRAAAGFPPFSPTSLPNALFWGRVSALTTTQSGNATPCSQWNDESGLGHHLTQTGALRPEFRSGGGGAFGSNNRPYLAFDVGNPVFMDTATWGVTPSLPVTLYVVGQTTNNTNNYFFAHNANDGSALDLTVMANFPNMRPRIENGASLFSDGTGGTWANASVGCFVFTATNSVIRFNNITSTSAVGSAGSNTSGPYGLRVGSLTGGFGSTLAGYVAAIHMYQGEHTAVERAHVMNACADFYGITVAA